MKKIIERVMDNSAVLAVVAVGLTIGVMAIMFLLFEGSSEDARPGAEVASEYSETTEALVDGDVLPFHIRSIPAPFVSADDGSIIGYVFLDVTLEVTSAEAREKAEGVLDVLIMDFTQGVSEAGIGMATRPGVVDYDRLARVFLELAEEKVGRGGIARVVVQATLEEE